MDIKLGILVLIIINNSFAADFHEYTADGGQRFGHDSGTGGYHQANLSPRGSVRGNFGHTDPKSGQSFRTEYSAGRAGFIAQGAHITRRGEDLGLNARLDVPNSKIPPPSKAFDYSFNSPSHTRREASDALGDVRGRYSYVDDVGIRRTVDYIAGKNTGFIVTSDNPDPPVGGQPAEAAYYRPSRRNPPLGPAGTRGYQSTKLNADGSYRFTHSSPNQRRTERKDALGRVLGEYSFIDDKGTRHRVQYEAGPRIGFRIISREPALPGAPPRPQRPFNFNTPEPASSTFDPLISNTLDFTDTPSSTTFNPIGPTTLRPSTFRPVNPTLRPPGSPTIRPPTLRPPSPTLRPVGAPTLRPPVTLRPSGTTGIRPVGGSQGGFRPTGNGGLRPQNSALRPSPTQSLLNPPETPLKPFTTQEDDGGNNEDYNNNDNNFDGYYRDQSTVEPDRGAFHDVTKSWESSTIYASTTLSPIFAKTPPSSPSSDRSEEEKLKDDNDYKDDEGISIEEADNSQSTSDENNWNKDDQVQHASNLPSWLAAMQEDPMKLNEKLTFRDRIDEEADVEESSRFESYQTNNDRWKNVKRTWTWINEKPASYEAEDDNDEFTNLADSTINNNWRYERRKLNGGSPVTRHDLRYLRTRLTPKTPRLAQVVSLD